MASVLKAARNRNAVKASWEAHCFGREVSPTSLERARHGHHYGMKTETGNKNRGMEKAKKHKREGKTGELEHEDQAECVYQHS